MRLLSNPKFAFMDFRKTTFLISGVLILASLVSLILHGGPRFGIDFRGGSFIEVRFEDKTNPLAEIDIPITEVRQVFADQGIENSEIKHYGSNQEIAIQLDVETAVDSSIVNSVMAGLQDKFPDYNVIERRRESVGPKIGEELVTDAVLAILASMVLILIYIMFRFELRFGVGAVLALLHDVIITLGIFSIFDIEITVPIIAAVLTIIGYSLNDTIVVYDRIRENLKAFKRHVAGYANLVNRSINETLSRTIVTSGTTLLVVVVLYFFGGEIIKNFAFALICGVIIGTYSSIFIASPVLVEWEERKASKVAVKKR